MSKRFQLVGSLLRPDTLLQYKRQIETNTQINYPFYHAFEGYEATEADAIRQVVQEQLAQGVSVISDGEFSKSIWHLDFLWGLGGVTRHQVPQGLLFKEKDGQQAFETRRDMGIRLTGPLSGVNHHFIKKFKQVQALAGDSPIKWCIPSPSHVYFDFIWSPHFTYEAVYEEAEDLKVGLVHAYEQFITDYAQAGGKILQFDDCRWALFADDNPASPFHNNPQVDTHALAQAFVALNNRLIDFAKSQGLAVWTHNCRGNYRSRHLSTGSYERIAQLFLGEQRYDRFFLEWDDERAGSLDALQVFQNTQAEVVLGLLSSKTPGLDDEARVLAALNHATTLVHKDRLYLSHQCGFASTDHGNELSKAQQWAKINQGQALAQAFWGA